PLVFFLLTPHPSPAAPCPYPTLFRSSGVYFSFSITSRVGTLEPSMTYTFPLGFSSRTSSTTALVTRQSVVTPLTSVGSGSPPQPDRKSTRLNSSHVKISYAVFCLKKK